MLDGVYRIENGQPVFHPVAPPTTAELENSKIGDASINWTHTATCSATTFKCNDTEALHQRSRVARWANIEAVARRKLDQLDAAGELRDMASPPGNRLEVLSGNRKGQHSIRINDQFRVCFVWTPQGPKNVEIVDYH